MAERKTGIVIHRENLSPLLELFRLAPSDGIPFPGYRAGQFIALSRENCKLTKKVVGQSGLIHYEYDRDENGEIKRGKVTHSYSIASAPYETQLHGFLEFYVVLELVKQEFPGRLSESLFHIDPDSDNTLIYVNKITGDFTLEKRAGDCRNVIMVGTGTGVAPFASMVKQLHYEATHGVRSEARYTLFHTNRTYREMGYHEELCSIAAAGAIDFVYVPSVSRPTPRDESDPMMGLGRANNVLRSIIGMPLKEEEDIDRSRANGEDVTRSEKLLPRVVRPRLPVHLSREQLLDRMIPNETVLLTCGNPKLMDDIRSISERQQIRFEKEEW